MNEDKRHFLIIITVVIILVVGYILSGIYLKQEPKQAPELSAPVNRIEKIREGFADK